MLKERIQSALKNPETQRKIAHVAGKVAAFVVATVAASVIEVAMDKGIDMVMDKIQHVEKPTA